MLCRIKNPIKYNGNRYREGEVDLTEEVAAILIARGDVELVVFEAPKESIVEVETDIEPEVNAPEQVSISKKAAGKKGGKASE